MIPWLRFSRVPRGTVYLMQSRKEPDLFKVGFTKRLTKDRRAELNRVAQDDMKIVSTVSMPWARKCEALVLERLRRNMFRKRDRRGTEWFWLRSGETIGDVHNSIGKAARRIELISRWKLSWPKQAEPRWFHSGVNNSQKGIE
ncbi:MAG: GIY-YIG nuclease family protein [Hyphomicrobiales bacterium]